MERYPQTRLRRLRQHDWIRNLVAETSLHPSDLIFPMFVRESHLPETLKTLPCIKRYALEDLSKALDQVCERGIPAVALFPYLDPDRKNPQATEAINPDNLICKAVRLIKKAYPHIGVMTDVALDPYTSHGHDGLLIHNTIHNDQTLEVLAEQALILAQSGADIVAPSDMMDGRIGAIRQALDRHDYTQTLILSYAIKYASSFYGPFREAVGAPSLQGLADKKTYQMDPRNARESLREVQLDIQEGADMILVKPGLPYLDILYQVHSHFSLPVLAYQVSGELAALYWAGREGGLSYKHALMESLVSMKRAGACAILSYGALEAAEWLQHP
jgi:porphobilinogen synthase